MSKSFYFFVLLAATVAGLFLLRLIDVRFDGRQILSVVVFSMFIYGTLLYGEFRLAFAFGGIALLLLLRLLTIEQFIQSASLDVIIFLVGTFLVIGFLEENQFFEHVISAIIRTTGPRPQRLLLVLMIMASVSSAMVGEVTAILFMAGAMLHLTSKYKLNPVPFVIMLVFASNIGSAASSVGNPIGVLIALKAHLSFLEFLRHAAPVALVVDVVAYFICRWWFAKEFAEFAAAVHREFAVGARAGAAAAPAMAAVGAGGADESIKRPGAVVLTSNYFDAREAAGIADLGPRGSYALCWAVFLGLVLLLVTHGLIERLFGLVEGTMMVGAALLMGAIVLLIQRERARELVERRVDWWTLSFFMMLFASVGTLEHTRVTAVIASKLASSTHDNPALVINVVGWATGWLSAFLDNVLAVATFMPVVHDIRARAPGEYSSAIYWMMLFGGTFMGNMTLIGSTANIVAVGLLEKRGHGTIRFWYWLKIGAIVSIASMLVATGMMALEERTIGIPSLPHPMQEAPGH